MEILDARGLECPLPVVKTKELLKEIDKVKVLVDNEIAIENLTKFAGVRHYQIVTGDDGDDFYAIIAKEGIDEELDFNEKSGDVVVISSKTMGSNEELGVVLMKSFIFALTKQDQLPKEMIFYNEGIFLTTNEGDILNDLKYLESQGVDIVSCGTCLDFFNRKELLQVGAVTNMRPDLFKVAIPRVGVMDMMRYHLFTIGWNWAPDYGTSADSPEMAKYLLDYSPLHNIKNDTIPRHHGHHSRP